MFYGKEPLYYYLPDDNEYVEETDSETYVNCITYQKRNEELIASIRASFNEKHKKLVVQLYYDNDAYATVKEIENELKRHDENKLIYIYCNRKDDKWYYSGYDYSSGTIQHVLVENNPINRHGELRQKTEDEICKEALDKFNYKIKPKEHMSQETETSPFVSSEEKEDSNDKVLRICQNFFWHWRK